jgi:hypothetical protein
MGSQAKRIKTGSPIVFCSSPKRVAGQPRPSDLINIAEITHTYPALLHADHYLLPGLNSHPCVAEVAAENALDGYALYQAPARLPQ